MPYQQAPPELGNQYDDDRMLRHYLEHVLPDEMLQEVASTLSSLGAESGGRLYEMQQADRTHEPGLTRWGPWGERIDRITVTPLWEEAERLAAEYGLVAEGYDEQYGRFSRVYQFALAYLFIPSTDMYGCPLAMTDGAARTLLASENRELIDRAVPHLTSRDPAQFWTSGQWMTELPGGSDVSKTETEARREDGAWRLYGRKWFTSAINAQMSLALARPEGGDDLALFYVELRDEDGRLQNIRVNRLKDKLGTRKVPTTELTLDGTPGVPVAGLGKGTRAMGPMLTVTRIWNAITAAAFMRRGLALARDYAGKRSAFGALLEDKPLHADTLAGLQAESEAAFHLAFRASELLGAAKSGDAAHIEHLLRLVTPLAKLTTARQCVGVCSEILEAFGGAGYIEDTGLPALLRDAQVLTIWEGTTNVLSLDLLRALPHVGGLTTIQQEIERCLEGVTASRLQLPVQRTKHALAHAERWMRDRQDRPEALEEGARRFALTLGRTLELALLTRHAAWALEKKDDDAPARSANRLAAHGVDMLFDE